MTSTQNMKISEDRMFQGKIEIMGRVLRHNQSRLLASYSESYPFETIPVVDQAVRITNKEVRHPVREREIFFFFFAAQPLTLDKEYFSSVMCLYICILVSLAEYPCWYVLWVCTGGTMFVFFVSFRLLI